MESKFELKSDNRCLEDFYQTNANCTRDTEFALICHAFIIPIISQLIQLS